MSFTLYPVRKQRLQRSYLAVPGSNPTMIDRALKSAADYVFLDCEDAVAPPEKEQARKNIIQALNDLDWKAAGKTVSVRINGLDTHYMYRDVVDIMEQAGSKLDTMLVPKVGVPADIYMVECLIIADRDGQGLHQPGRHRSADRDAARHGQRRGHRRRSEPARGRCISASPTTPPSTRRARWSSVALTQTIRAISGTSPSPA